MDVGHGHVWLGLKGCEGGEMVALGEVLVGTWF